MAWEDLSGLRIDWLAALLVDWIRLGGLWIDWSSSFRVESVWDDLAGLEVLWLSVLWIEGTWCLVPSSWVDRGTVDLVHSVRSLGYEVLWKSSERIVMTGVWLLGDWVYLDT